MKIERIDHLVLTVRDIETTCKFYAGVLGMEIVTFGGGRKAMAFGMQKINLLKRGANLSRRRGIQHPVPPICV